MWGDFCWLESWRLEGTSTQIFTWVSDTFNIWGSITTSCNSNQGLCENPSGCTSPVEPQDARGNISFPVESACASPWDFTRSQKEFPCHSVLLKDSTRSDWLGVKLCDLRLQFANALVLFYTHKSLGKRSQILLSPSVNLVPSKVPEFHFLWICTRQSSICSVLFLSESYFFLLFAPSIFGRSLIQ